MGDISKGVANALKPVKKINKTKLYLLTFLAVHQEGVSEVSRKNKKGGCYHPR